MQLKQVRDGFTLDITHEINYDSNPNPNPKPNPNSNPNPNSIPGSSLKNRSNPKPSPNPDLNPNIGKLDFGVMRHGLASQGIYPESDAPEFEFQRTRVFSKIDRTLTLTLTAFDPHRD